MAECKSWLVSSSCELVITMPFQVVIFASLILLLAILKYTASLFLVVGGEGSERRLLYSSCISSPLPPLLGLKHHRFFKRACWSPWIFNVNWWERTPFFSSIPSALILFAFFCLHLSFQLYCAATNLFFFQNIIKPIVWIRQCLLRRMFKVLI